MKNTNLAIVAALLALVGCTNAIDHANQAFLDKDYKTALAEYQALAAKGDSSADSQLAYMYLNGDGVEKDPAEGQRWLEKSALDGSDLAARMLGEAYLYRTDAEPDYAQAFKWYKLAADRYEPNSALKVSIFYENGLGVPRDDDAAIHYLNEFVGKTDIVGQQTYYKYSGGDNTGGFMDAVQQTFGEAVYHTPQMRGYAAGTVVLSFHEQDGRATDVTVVQSSGDPDADATTVALMQKTYLPPVLPSLAHVEHFQMAFSFGAPKPARLYGSGPATH